MNHKWIRDINLHKIKVNKKGSHNKILKAKNTVFNSYIDYLNLTKIPNINPINRQTTKSAYNIKNQNLYINKNLKNNSNSEEKMKKNNLHIKCIEENILLNKEGNILDDLINNRYLKPILESQDIDEKLLNCNLKEPVKNNFNVSLRDFFNRRKKYYINFKTPKPEMNKIRGISIKTNNYNNYNEELSGISIYNKTMGNTETNINHNSRYNNSNINNYYNNIKMTNNYYNNYNNNEINILNPPFYNKGIKINNICSSSVRKKMRKYISNYNSNERNNINTIKSPDLHVFKSQTYSQEEKNYSENYLKYKNNKKIRNNINKEINIKNLTNINNDNINNNEEINEEDNINKKYNDIKNIIKHNNKYDYSKKLFDIYRGKLIKEFLRHIQKGINKYLLNIFHYFIEQIQLNDKKYLKKIDEIFIPKIHLEKPNKDLLKENNNIIKSPYLQIFNSEKKEYKRYMNNTNKITEYKRYKNNININNSAIINQKIIDNNNNIIKTNRNSMIIEEDKNNIQIIKLNTNNNNNSGLIYKKKKLNNKFQKKNKENVLSNSRGKIIDIDINLGKPIREISDINPMESGIFINKYDINKKKYKSSLSTNKREKRKIKSKSKRKKLSLPKKKYLEEISDSSTDKDNFYLDKNNSNFNIDNIDNSFDKHINNNNFSIKTNNNIIQPLIYKNSKMNNNKNKTYQINTNKYKNISEKNIVTSDKRLFININYISCLSYENNLNPKMKYKNSSLIIKRNIYFPIFSQKIIRNKTTSNNFIYISNINRNSNNILERKNKRMNMTNYITNDKNKYLNSCVKFIIKNINKVFLGKSFYFFLNECKKRNKNNNKSQNKYRLKAYKKKIGNNKV